MEIDRSTRFSIIESSSSTTFCLRCSAAVPRGNKCGKCQAALQEERHRLAMEALAFQSFKPLEPDHQGSFRPRIASDPFLGDHTQGQHMRRSSVSVSRANIVSNPYPEVQGRWLSGPNAPPSSSHPSQGRPAMVLSQPTRRPMPPTTTSIPHFNTKGELIQAPPRQPSMHEIRICNRLGCAAVIPENDPSDICPSCRLAASQSHHKLHRIRHPVTGPSAVPLISEPPVIHSSDTTPEDIDDLELLYPEPEPGTQSQLSNSAQRATPPQESPQFIDLTIGHPPQYPLMNPSPSPRPRPPPNPLQMRHPPPPRPKPAPAIPSHAQQTQPRPAPRPSPVKIGQKCIKSKCNNILFAESTSSRCVSCIKKEWKSRTQALAESEVPRPHKKRKTVTWEDMPKPDLGASENRAVKAETGKNQPMKATSSVARSPAKLKIRIPALRPSSTTPDPSGSRLVESATVMDPPPSTTAQERRASSTSSSSSPRRRETPASESSSPPRDTPPTSASPTQSHPSFTSMPSVSTNAPASSKQPLVKDVPLTSTTPLPPIPIPPAAAGPSPLTIDPPTLDSVVDNGPLPPPTPISSTTAAPSEMDPDPTLLDAVVDERPCQPISGWDSDLTNLSDLTDLGESEVDEASSSDAESSTEERPSFKIRIPARPIVPSAEARICTIPKCRRVLDDGYRWKCCVQCRLHHREYQRKRQGLQGRHKRLDVETDRVTTDFPQSDPTAKLSPDHLAPGARLCTIKSCTHIIPSREEYRWKMCQPCRIRTRNNQNKLRSKKLGKTPPMETSVEPGSGSEAEDIPLAAVLNQLHETEGSLRRCRKVDCGLLINPKSQDTLCNQCRARRTKQKVRPSVEVDSLPKTIVIRNVPPPRKIIPPYSEFISWSTLLDTFHTRISSFFEAHRFYLRFKQSCQPAGPVQKATFKFNGEYSVVMLDFKVLGRRDEIHRQTLGLKDEIGRVGDLMFLSTYWVTILEEEQGVATRFECKVRSLKAAEMKGELEIAVLPDHTHILFPGQRTIVRFCLIG